MYNVRIKTPEEMGLTSKVQLFEDGLRTSSKSGSYEWWYSDCKFPDGSSLVIIFFAKPVTSMANKFEPYVSFDFVSPTKQHIHTEYKSSDYFFSKDAPDIKIGNCTFKGDLSHYEIYFKNDVVESTVIMDATVPSWRPYSGHLYFNENDYFAWLPAVPEGKVKAVIKTASEEMVYEGTGYHDHNWGNKLMIFLMNDWYWGRAKIGDYVVVSAYIYANKKQNHAPTPVFMLAKNGKIIADDAYSNITYTEKDFVKDPYTKRHVAKTIIYDYNDGDNRYKITYLKGNEEVERRIMRTIVSKPLAALFYLLGFRGSYHRMSGTVTLERYEKGELKETISSPAMWEQMAFKPDRIK
ncbi:MAG: hypothetical protein IKL82_01950 [Clostridia bacterium]|nr:hypothetical protein [Clostridia bacterium]